MQRAMPNGRPRKRPAPVVDTSLPWWCANVTCDAKSSLAKLSQMCGNDLACWRDAIARIKVDLPLPGEVPPTPAPMNPP